MDYPVFVPRVWQKGERCTYEGKVYASISTSKKTAPPKNGTVWTLVVVDAVVKPPTSYALYAADYGLQTGPDRDNAPLLNKLIAELPEDTGHKILLPPGLIDCFSTVTASKKSITFEGVDNATTLRFPPRTVGFDFVPGYGGDHPTLRNLIITATSRDDTDGMVNGVRSRNGLDYRWHAISAQTLLKMDSVTIANFSGHHVNIIANRYPETPELPYGLDANMSKLSDVHARGAGGFNFFFSGDNANHIQVDRCSARDAGLGNFGDFSRLGARFNGCMAHRANTWGLENGYGHYVLADANNHGTVDGCYGEGDSPRSYLNGRATRTGGLHENGWVESGFAGNQDGNTLSSLQVGGISLDALNMRFAANNAGGCAPLFLRNMEPDGNVTRYELAHPEHFGSMPLLEFCQSWGALNNRNVQSVPSIGVTWLYIGDVLHLSMNTHGRHFSFNQDLPALLYYRPGSVIEFADREAAYAPRLLCVEAGLGNKARWRVDGAGIGTTAQRPGPENANYSFFGTQYTANDVYLGWHYWNTDMGQDQIWNGKAWVDALGRPTE